MSGLWRFLIRVSAFWRKDIIEVWRQPRLMLTLILGPFLILVLFAIGFRSAALPVRVLFVVGADNPLRPFIESHARLLVQQLIFEGIVESQSTGLQQLRSGQVDLVVVAPANPYQTIAQDQHPDFTFYHDYIDPANVSYISSFAQVFIGQFNRQILESLVADGQQLISTVQQDLNAIRSTVQSLLNAVKQAQTGQAQQYLADLKQQVVALQSDWSSALLLLGTEGILQPGNDGSEPVQALLRLQRDVDALNAANLQDQSILDEIEKLLQDLESVISMVNSFERVTPDVVISPFSTKIESLSPELPNESQYYSPPAIALLLQHMAITFAALSIVLETRLGTLELFQASPLSALEILIGKYVSYGLLVIVLIALLTAVVVLWLNVPMLGSWGAYAGATVAVLFVSLSGGFVLSLLSQTTSQAVQYSMIVLLFSVFFSGLFIDLNLLHSSVRIISYVLPATYGIQLYHDIMLRGRPPDPISLVILVGMGVGLFLFAWWLLNRRMNRT